MATSSLPLSHPSIHPSIYSSIYHIYPTNQTVHCPHPILFHPIPPHMATLASLILPSFFLHMSKSGRQRCSDNDMRNPSSNKLRCFGWSIVSDDEDSDIERMSWCWWMACPRIPNRNVGILKEMRVLRSELQAKKKNLWRSTCLATWLSRKWPSRPLSLVLSSAGGHLQWYGEQHIAPAKFGDSLCLSQFLFLCRPLLFLVVPHLLDTDHHPILVVSCSDAGDLSVGVDSLAVPICSTPAGTHDHPSLVMPCAGMPLLPGISLSVLILYAVPICSTPAGTHYHSSLVMPYADMLWCRGFPDGVADAFASNDPVVVLISLQFTSCSTPTGTHPPLNISDAVCWHASDAWDIIFPRFLTSTLSHVLALSLWEC